MDTNLVTADKRNTGSYYCFPPLAHTHHQDSRLQHFGAVQFKENFSHTRFVVCPSIIKLPVIVMKSS